MGCSLPYSMPEMPSKVEYEFKHEDTKEPLRFEATDKTVTSQQQFPIGERKIYSPSGHYWGKEVVYETRTVSRDVHHWDIYQGDEKIDPYSALFIARDKAFMDAYSADVARVQSDHDRARELYRVEVEGMQGRKNVGTALLVMGLVGIVGASFIVAATTDDKPTAPGAEPAGPSPVAYAVALGGVGLSIGGYFVRSNAISKQEKAMSEVRQLSSSRVNDSSFQKFRSEEHLKKAIEKSARKRKPKQEAEGEAETPKTAATAPTPPAALTSLPMPKVNVNAMHKRAVDNLIPNNKKLGQALVGIWTPDASGQIPPQAHDTLDKELIRSKLYWNDEGGKIALHEGNLIIYTDEASLKKNIGQEANPKAISLIELCSVAMLYGVEIYLHHDTDVGFFTVLTNDRIVKLLKMATE